MAVAKRISKFLPGRVVTRAIYDPKIKNVLLDYLRHSGKEVAWAAGCVIDAFTGEPSGPPEVAFTDGEYHWQESEIYHLDKYDLALESDFITYVLSQIGKGN